MLSSIVLSETWWTWDSQVKPVKIPASSGEIAVIIDW
jgi:hypothetical protein